MIKNTLPLRLFLAVFLFNARALPAFAEDVEDKKPPATPVTGPRTVWAPDSSVANLLEEMQAELGNSKHGHFGAAQSVLARAYKADDETKGAMLKAAKTYLYGNPLTASLGEDRLSESTVDGLLANPKNMPVTALLFDAKARPGLAAELMARYNKMKEDTAGLPADKRIDTFDKFVLELIKNQNDPNIPPAEKAVHKILTAMDDPTGPGGKKDEDDEEEWDAERRAEWRRRMDRAEDQARTFFNVDEVQGRIGDMNVFQVGGRTLAFNPVAVKGEDGRIVQKLALCDRTNVSDIVCQSFAFDDPALKSAYKFQLDDRENSQNTRYYTINLVPEGGDIKVVFTGDKGEKVPVPSVGALFKNRARKIRDLGYVVKVGDREFYAGAEAHSGIGQVTYWSREMLDNIGKEDFNPMDLVPEMVSVAVKREGGRDVPVASSSIGQVGDQWYDLRWNKQKGVMEVVKGLPPSGGLGSGVPGGGGELREGPSDMPIDAKMKLQGLKPLNLNTKLTGAAAGRARFYFRASLPEGVTGNIGDVFMMLDGNPALMMPVDRNKIDIVTGNDGKGNVLAMLGKSTGGGMMISYLDLRKDIPLVKDPDTGESSFQFGGAMVGTFNMADRSYSKIIDKSVAEQVLKIAGYSSATRNKIMDRMGTVTAGGKPWQIDGNGEKVWLSVEGTQYDIYPGDAVRQEPGGELDRRSAEVEGEGGIVIDNAVPQTVDAKLVFPGEIRDVAVGEDKFTLTPLPKGAKQIEKQKAGGDDRFSDAHARLYRGVRGEGGNKKQLWLLASVIYSKKSKELRQIRAPLFSSPKREKLAEFPGADKIVVAGIPFGDNLPADTNGWDVRWAKVGRTSFKEKGVVYVLDAPSGKKYENYVGVIAYWGMSYADAVKEARSRAKSG